MVLPPNGPISIQDLRDEFGGDAPDSIEEYYRGGDYVTENNTNVPSCATADCEVSLSDYYNGELVITKVITTSIDEITLSSYFTETEWVSPAPKEVVINAGVTIGSFDATIPAIKTGILVNTQPLNGILRLVNNGFIFGSGGIGSTTVSQDGGTAIDNQIPLEIVNNSSIRGGGGSGGAGGQGADTYWWPIGQTDLYIAGSGTIYGNVCDIYNATYVPSYFDIWWHEEDDIDGIVSINYGGNNVFFAYLPNQPPYPTQYNCSDGFTCIKGSLVVDCFGNGARKFWAYKRRTTAVQVGGPGGKGGDGIGAHNVRLSGLVGSVIDNGVAGGRGQIGGDWGLSGIDGDPGRGADSEHSVVIASRPGIAAGLGGFYVTNNATITWTTIGDLRGRAG